jgi:Mn-dependent DtxR family transcriptional regulator
VVHLLNHEGAANQQTESSLAHLSEELRWTPAFAQETTRRALREGLVEPSNGQLELTGAGRAVARQVMAR